MLDQVLNLFHVVPDHDLNIMREGQSLADITAAAMRGLQPILARERPDWVLVQGDTTTTMAASLAAFYSHIRIGHIEAGLRTHNKQQPFPEEVNRRITSVLADLHFAPTQQAADNLRREGVPGQNIRVTGNTVIDALHRVLHLPFDPRGTGIGEILLGAKRIIIVTAHRRENFGQGMDEICRALRTIAQRFPDVHIVWPVHMNPHVRTPALAYLSNIPNISLLPPLEYQPLVWLLKQCTLVITDSGGLQEEAPGLGKPVLVARESTERPEGVAAGTVRLVGARYTALVEETTRLLTDLRAYQTMALAINPYGDGHAAEYIATALCNEDAIAAHQAPGRLQRGLTPAAALMAESVGGSLGNAATQAFTVE